MRKFIYIISCFICSNLLSQEKSKLVRYEDSLIIAQRNLFKLHKGDANYNTQFDSLIYRALRLDYSETYPFDSLKEIGIISSPDNLVRIVNWNLPLRDGTHQYFGYIQAFSTKLKKWQLFKLNDCSSTIKNSENYTSDHQKWFGMLYYKIIPVKHKKKKYYTLLAWDGNDKLTSKKIIDVLTFNADGTPHFGADVFKLEKKTVKRVVFEYSAQAVMSLKYNEDKKLIVFDHLAPSQSKLEGQFQYYGPDFSFDALNFSKGKWIYIPDIDARNNRNKNDNNYNNPKENKPNNDDKKMYKPVDKKQK
jgi:hypothetical protein